MGNVIFFAFFLNIGYFYGKKLFLDYFCKQMLYQRHKTIFCKVLINIDQTTMIGSQYLFLMEFVVFNSFNNV